MTNDTEYTGKAVNGIANGLIPALVFWAILLYLASGLTGCGPSQGWAFTVGINPINAVDAHSTLNTRESNYLAKGDYQNDRTTK